MRRQALCLALLLFGAGAAPAAETAPPPTGKPANSVEVSKPLANPYLPDAFAPDEMSVLPPPPAADFAGQKRDVEVFDATRRYEGTPRWALAQRDANDKPDAVARDFSCAAERLIDPAKLPALSALLERVNSDTYLAVLAPKDHYRRARPLVGNSAPICLDRTERLARSGSYPSGHATIGWVYALLLAELLPERATAILDRGRTYGESRVICGVHWLSDIEAGRLDASALVAALHGSAVFRADLDRARGELADYSKQPGPPLDPATCRVEADAAATPLPQ